MGVLTVMAVQPTGILPGHAQPCDSRFTRRRQAGRDKRKTGGRLNGHTKCETFAHAQLEQRLVRFSKKIFCMLASQSHNAEGFERVFDLICSCFDS